MNLILTLSDTEARERAGYVIVEKSKSRVFRTLFTRQYNC